MNELVPASPGAAFCAQHPDVPAVGSCSRCGAFACAADSKLLGTGLFCATCAARPDVDYLEGFRAEHWGRRDGWTWLVGLWVLSYAPLAITTLAQGLRAAEGPDSSLVIVAASYALAAVASGLFFAGVAQARAAVILNPILLGAVGLVFGGSGSRTIPGAAIGLLVGAAIYKSPLNRMFFKLEVSRADLQREWDLRRNNTLARAGMMLGILGILIPLVSPIAFVLGVIGRSRVNPNAHPPIGRKGQATAAIVLGIVGSVWGLALVAILVATKS